MTDPLLWATEHQSLPPTYGNVVQSSSYHVLFVSSSNSGRSIMAEAILNRLGKGAFQAYSCGIHPTGRVNPFTIHELDRRGYATSDLVSKSISQFTMPGSIAFDYVISVCDLPDLQPPPNWAGQPRSLAWSFASPGSAAGPYDAVAMVFAEVCGEIEAKLKQFISDVQGTVPSN